MGTFTSIGMLVSIALVMVILAVVNRRRNAERLRAHLQASFGKIPTKQIATERYEMIGGYLDHHPGLNQIDDITWNDLDMDRIYQRIDSTLSAAGEEYLYYRLRTPLTQEELQGERGQKAKAIMSYFEDQAHEGERIRIQTVLARLGHSGKFSIYTFLDLLEEVKEESNLFHYFCCLLPFVSLGLMFVSVQVGTLALIGSLIFNMTTYYHKKGAVDPYVITFRYLLRAMQAGDEIASVSCTGIEEDRAVLKKLGRDFARFRRGSSMIMGQNAGTGNPLDIIMDYSRILFHLDLIKFNTMLHEIRKRKEEVDSLITILGRLDTQISVASFRRSLPVYATPKWKEEKGRELKITGLYHPLIQEPVENDIIADRSVLLTGSNASGKSTFIKAVALAVLLSETILTAPAREIRTTYFRIYSSMALRDNITQGESYFMVEIKSLKRILDAAGEKEEAPVLCFIDEVLRGTNTIERIAASTQILQTLAQGDVMCFAATHDIELTDLLAKEYDNYHFEEEIVGNDVEFSYRLHTGRATTRNAIRLLTSVGFDPAITEKASQRAKHFEDTGMWS